MNIYEEMNLNKLTNKTKIMYDIIIEMITKINEKKQKKNKKPLLILGPSGVGKDTMINKLKEKYPNKFYKLPSYTTRPMRKGEKEGIDYFFITKEAFKKMEEEGKLFGIQEYNNNYYASNKGTLKEVINKGDKIIILNYNIETANSIKDEIKFNYIAIMPPCEKELRNRLIKRGTKPEEITNRMNNSLREMQLINEANYIDFRVVNDKEDTCLRKIEEHIKKLYPQFF